MLWLGGSFLNFFWILGVGDAAWDSPLFDEVGRGEDGGSNC